MNNNHTMDGLHDSCTQILVELKYRYSFFRYMLKTDTLIPTVE